MTIASVIYPAPGLERTGLLLVAQSRHFVTREKAKLSPKEGAFWRIVPFSAPPVLGLSHCWYCRLRQTPAARRSLLIASGGGVAHADGVGVLEKARGIRPHAEVLAKLFVFTSGRFGRQREDALFTRSPRLGIGHGVVDGDLPFYVVSVHAPDCLPPSHLVSVHIAPGIEPGSVVESI